MLTRRSKNVLSTVQPVGAANNGCEKTINDWLSIQNCCSPLPSKWTILAINHSGFISAAAVALSAHIFVLCLFQPKVHKHRLSVWNKLCYAVGGAPYQITGSALGFFLQIYLLDVAQVTENDSKATGATLGVQSVKKQPIPSIAILRSRV